MLQHPAVPLAAFSSDKQPSGPWDNTPYSLLGTFCPCCSPETVALSRKG